MVPRPSRRRTPQTHRAVHEVPRDRASSDPPGRRWPAQGPGRDRPTVEGPPRCVPEASSPPRIPFRATSGFRESRRWHTGDSQERGIPGTPGGGQGDKRRNVPSGCHINEHPNEVGPRWLTSGESGLKNHASGPNIEPLIRPRRDSLNEVGTQVSAPHLKRRVGCDRVLGDGPRLHGDPSPGDDPEHAVEEALLPTVL